MVKSVIVRKTRARWYLEVNALYEGETPSIDWGSFFPLDCGTKHQRSYMLESCKGLLMAMIDAPRDRKGPILAHGSVLNWAWLIRRLARWMIAIDVWRFSALTAPDLVAYIEDCAEREDGRGKVSSFTLNLRVRVLQEMWNLRRRYIAGLRVNPAALAMPPLALAHRQSSWRALDESRALPLIRDAITWLNSHSAYLLSVFQRTWRDSSVGRTRGQHRKKRTILYAEMEQEEGLQKLRRDLGGAEKSTYLVLLEAVKLTNGACITILLFLIGMRIRELTRLDSQCLKKELDVGGNDIYRIHGIAAKQDGKARTWISCGPVNDAINYLERSCSEARESSGQQALFAAPRTEFFPSPGRKLIRTTPGIVRNRMVAFARSKFRANSPAIQRLHPHVARKTFARFVVLRDKQALESVSYHFGHVHRLITDGYYVGSDLELAQLIAEEGRRDLAQGLTELLSAPYVGGKAGAVLLKLKGANDAKFKGKKAVRGLVEKLIGDGVQLAPCDWGYCVYSQTLSACLGDARGPDESRRSPDICSSCSNFAVTERHRGWWEQRLSRDEDFLQQYDLPEQTVRWVARRRSNTAGILTALNDTIHINSG